MNDITQLAHWRISTTDELSIQLVSPTGLSAISRTLKPSLVRVVWPAAPSQFYLQHFPTAAVYAAQTSPKRRPNSPASFTHHVF
jgi:hypothetical protein